MKTLNVSILILASTIMFSCVTSKKFNDMESRYQMENEGLKNNLLKAETENKELSGSLIRTNSLNKELNTKLENLGYDMEVLKRNRESLEKEKATLEAQLKAIQTGTSTEIQRLMTELQKTRDDLNAREDKIRESEKELLERNLRLMELQEALKQKEEAVNRLRQTVTSALTGFNNNGLTVFEKDGKVYVSLEEQLLFKSGQWEVDPRGQQALKDLGDVLAQNPDINIMVEGHTDDVPMRGANQVKDNWDLSVMRATAVTKVLLQNRNIDPVRIIAAGRSEYLPLDLEKSPDARKKNRRTEIILTPKLDELLKLMEN